MIYHAKGVKEYIDDAADAFDEAVRRLLEKAGLRRKPRVAPVGVPARKPKTGAAVSRSILR